LTIIILTHLNYKVNDFFVKIIKNFMYNQVSKNNYI